MANNLSSGTKRRRPIFEFIGWIPAVIIPTATLLQFLEALTSDSVEGIDAGTWVLFGVANVCFYLYAEKYRSPQTILGFLGSAALDFAIVAVVLVRG